MLNFFPCLTFAETHLMFWESVLARMLLPRVFSNELILLPCQHLIHRNSISFFIKHELDLLIHFILVVLDQQLLFILFNLSLINSAQSHQ